MLLSFETPFAGASVVRLTGAALRRCTGLTQRVPPESTDHGKRTIGVPRELRSSCRSLGDFPAGDTGPSTPGLGGARPSRSAEVSWLSLLSPANETCDGCGEVADIDWLGDMNLKSSVLRISRVIRMSERG